MVMAGGNVTLVSAYGSMITVMAIHTVKMGVMNQPCAVSACARFTIHVPIFVTISNCRSESNVCSQLINRCRENMH